MAEQKVNPFAVDEVPPKEVLNARLGNEGVLDSLSEYAAAVLREFISATHGEPVNGVDLVAGWVDACMDYGLKLKSDELPAKNGFPIFPEVVQFMGLDRDVVETALAVYAAIDPRYTYTPPQPF